MGYRQKSETTYMGLFLNIIPFISLGVSIIVFNKSYNTNGYEYYFLVPLFFAIFLVVIKLSKIMNFKYIGITVLFHIMFIKYVITPLISSLGDYTIWNGIVPSTNNIFTAVIVTIVEMATIFITTMYLYRKKADNSVRVISPIKNKIVYIIFVIFAILIALFYPKVLEDYRFIFSSTVPIESIRVEVPLAGLFKTIVRFGQIIITILILEAIRIRSNKSNKFIILFFSILIVLLNLLVTSNLSRFTILIPAIAYLYILLKVYPKNAKFIFITITSSVFLVIAFLSIQKFFTPGRGGQENINSIFWWADTVQMYFSGPKNIAISLESLSNVRYIYGYNRFPLIIYDIFSNIAFLSNYVPYHLNSISIFNNAYYSSSVSVDQIPPIVSTGIYYFGLVFYPVWTILTMFIMKKLDAMTDRSLEIDSKFIYAYVSIFFAFSIVLSTSTVFSQLVNTLLIFIAFTKINKYIKI